MPRELIINLPRLHPGQAEVLQHPARFKVLACGRRWGKTSLGIVMAMTHALRGGRAWWVAPSYPMSLVGWRGLKALAPRQAVNPVGQTVELPTTIREGDRAIIYPGGGVVQVRSADNPDSLRGEGLDFVVLDECAFMRPEAWTEALRPALSDRQGGALFISTPRGLNWFHSLYQRAASGDNPDWAAWRYPTSENPMISPDEIEAARASLPSSVFEQEYLAAFIEDGGQVFRNVRECLWEPPTGPEPGRTYYMGVDWAQLEDFTVLTVIDDMGRVVAIDRFNQIGWHHQYDRLRTMADAWGVITIMAEANAMGVMLEQMQADGLPVVAFTTTSKSKAQAIQALALAFERGTIAIPADNTLLAELAAFQADMLPSGAWRYGAPSGMHDDMVMSLALAYWAVAMPAGAALVDFVTWR